VQANTMLEDPHALLPIAYQAAVRIVRSPLLAEEAGERALHLLTLALLRGDPPTHPKAWLRTVARRSAGALLRSEWARTHGAGSEELERHQAPYRGPRPDCSSMVREQLAGALPPRQWAALSAAFTCNSTRAAARSCGMKPRDFRRSMSSISRKAKRLLGDLANDPRRSDALADSPCVQFRLET